MKKPSKNIKSSEQQKINNDDADSHITDEN